MAAHPRLRRAFRIAILTASALAGVAAVIVLLLLLPPVRERILAEAIRQARGRVPGTIAAGAARWPAPGKLELEDLLWTDGPDTLLAVRRLSLSVSVPALIRRDVHVHGVGIETLRADLPAIRSRFPAGASEPPPAGGEGRSAFPRPGALPGIPSAAMDELTVTGSRVRLPDSTWVTGLDVALSFDLLAGHDPRLRIARLTARNEARGWGVDGTALTVDARAGRIEGTSAGRAAPGWPYRLTVSSEADDHARLELDLGETAPAAVRLDLRLERKDLRLEAVGFDLVLDTPSVEELARVPELSARLEAVPSLEGLRVDAEGRVTLLPRVSAEAGVELRENPWLESGRAGLRYDDGGITVDTLGVALPDLLVAGRGAMSGDSLRAEASVTVTGTRWLTLIQPGTVPPESLAARLDLRLSGPAGAPAVRADLAGGARVGGFVLDRIEIAAETAALNREPALVSLRARALDIELRAEAEVEAGETVSARVAPLLVRDVSTPRGPAPAGARTGRVTFDPETGALSVAGLEIGGDAGRLRLDGERSGDGAARLALEARWVEAPRLLTREMKLDPAALDSLRAAFRRDGPFTLTLRGRAKPEAKPPQFEANGRFHLPGPRTLSSLMPAGARTDDLGPLRGALSARTVPENAPEIAEDWLLSALDGPAGPWTLIDLDLGETAWLDTTRAGVLIKQSGQAVFTSRVGLEGIALNLLGSRRDSLWNVHSDFRITDPGFIARFLEVPGDSLVLEVDARAHLQGTAADPLLNAELHGRFADGRISVPRVLATATVTRDSADARIELPEGATTGSFAIAGAEASFRTEPAGRGFLPARVGLSAHNPELSLSQELRLEPGPGWNARVDRLAFAYRGHDLRSLEPFRVSVNGADSVMRIEPFSFAGDLGRVTGEGSMNPAGVDLRAEATITPPPNPMERIPAGLWPQELTLSLRAEGRHDVALEAAADGLSFGRREDLSLSLNATAGLEGGQADLVLGDGTGELFRARGVLPLLIDFVPFSTALRHDSVQVAATWDRFPLPLGPEGFNWNAENPALLTGAVNLDGTPARPELRAGFTVSFPDWPQLAEHRLEATMPLPAGDGPSPGAAFSPAELTADLTFHRNDATLLRGEASVPVLLGVDTVAVRVDPERPAAFRVRSEALTLADFNPFLPPQTSLGGQLTLDLEAAGPADELNLSGELAASEVRAATSEGTRATAALALRLGGTSKRPAVTGRVEIKNGVIRIPDPPKSLHPARGEAVLWDRPESLETAADSAAVRPPDAAPDAAPDAPPLEADLDVRVVIPSGLWIRGRQLDVELAGDLTLVQSGALPTVTGELRAVRGRLVFLGRTFLVERGGVEFYGEDELNPVLDLALSAVVEGTRINIVVSGTALEPKLALTSEPELPEGDIMSLLLFGRPLGDLDNDQMTLLENRAADVAASYAASELEARLSRQLGVDMVTIQRGRDTGREDALVIGKYLSPRALLKYEQALKGGAGFFVNLEYLLTRSLKIETLIGPQSQSGVEVNWTRDY